MNRAFSSSTNPSGVRGVCPTDWHLSSDSEWHQLILFLDPSAVNDISKSLTAGGMLKGTGTTHWINTEANVTNRSGFTALPAGRRTPLLNIFKYIGQMAEFWSATDFSSSGGGYIILF